MLSSEANAAAETKEWSRCIGIGSQVLTGFNLGVKKWRRGEVYRLTTYSYFVVECPEIEREEDFS